MALIGAVTSDTLVLCAGVAQLALISPLLGAQRARSSAASLGRHAAVRQGGGAWAPLRGWLYAAGLCRTVAAHL